MKRFGLLFNTAAQYILRETLDVAEVEAKRMFLSIIPKVQLAKDTGKKERLPSDKTIEECVQEMVDASSKEEEFRNGEEEVICWNRASYTS